jgi:tetratricopeptide (TPR) repeat protein
LSGGFFGGFNRFGFGSNFFYSAGFPNAYYGSTFPYYGNSFYSSSTFYPPYPGGVLQYGTEVPITYLPMRGTVPATPVNPAPLLNQLPQDPLIQLDRGQLPTELEQLEPLDLADRPVRRSSLENRLKARQEQIKGDLAFREQNRLKAHGYYRQAADYAEDLASVQFRLAVSYAAMGKFDLAVDHLKRVLELEPAWPQEGEGLSRMYDSKHVIARNSMLIRLSDWVGEDIRDPDRLLLMGAFLFETSPDKAREFLLSSAQLSGNNRYTEPFLNPDKITAAKQTSETTVQDDLPLDLVIPDPPRDDAEPPRTRTIPVPPLPESESSEPPPSNESSESTERYVPRDLGFTHPRHGGDSFSSPTLAPALEGPRIPVLGN